MRDGEDLSRSFLLLLAIGMLTLHASFYLPFVSDDALISLRYSQRLARGAGLTWNDGERVEGYSNLLWVLGLALYGRVTGGDLVLGARVLGVLSMVAAMAALVLGRHSRSPAAVEWGFPLLFFVLSGPVAVWAIGGMEQPLIAALLAWSVALLDPLLEEARPAPRRLLAVGALLGLLCLTRPDAPLFVAAIVAAMTVGRRGAWKATLRDALLVVVLPVVMVAGQLAFRLNYYGEWVPNTALVKWGPSPKHLESGLGYLGQGLLSLSPLVLLAGLSAALGWLHGYRRRFILVLVLSTLAWSAHVVLMGGDTLPAWRHLVPLVVLFVLLLRTGWEWIAGLPDRRKQRAWVLSNVAMLCAFALLQVRDGENRRAREEVWEWDGKTIGETLRRSFGTDRPLLAVDAAGCLPFWSELPSLDMLGLNDAHIPRHKPEDYGTGPLGHELGDGSYVLDRGPDLIIFGPPPGSASALFRSGLEMQQLAEFEDNYLLAWLSSREMPPLITPLWIRWTSSRIGIACTEDRCVVPGHVFEQDSGSLLEGEARVCIRLTPGDRAARRNGVLLRAGTWAVDVASRGSPVHVTVSARDQGEIALSPTTPRTFTLAGERETAVDLRISSEGPAPAWVEEVVLSRRLSVAR